MTIKYVAFDGTEFDTRFQCETYEKKRTGCCVMWDRNGEFTTDTDCAYLVFLDEYGYSRMLNLAEDADEPVLFIDDDIDDSTIGYFVYDEWEGKYAYLDDSVISCLLKTVGLGLDVLKQKKDREIARLTSEN